MYFVTSLLLARNFLLASLFSFQGADLLIFFKIRLKHFFPKMLQSNFGGDNRNRTDDPLLARQVLSQLSYTPIFKRLVGPSGLEPPTSRLSVVRSSQLSYGPMRTPSKLNNVMSSEDHTDHRTLQQTTWFVEVSLERR